MEDDSICKELIDYAKTLRYTQKGKSVNYNYLIKNLRKTVRFLMNKSHNNQPLSDCEKWIIDNAYLVFDRFYRLKIPFSDLPFVKENPRIVLLCRFIIDRSYLSFSSERMEKCFEAIAKTIHLEYSEICFLEDGLFIALLEQIYILCKRVQYDNQCKINAESKKLNKKLIDSDTYLYYYYKKKHISESDKKFLAQKGFNEKESARRYQDKVLFDTFFAEMLFSALRNLGQLFPMTKSIQYLSSYQVLNENKSLSNLTFQTICSYLKRMEKIAKKAKVCEEYVAKNVIELSKKEGKDISILLLDEEKDIKKYCKTHKEYHKKENQVKETIFTFCVPFLALIFSSIVYFFCTSISFSILSFIPFFLFFDMFFEQILDRHIEHIPLPQYNYKSVGSDNQTSVVISEFCSSFDKFQKSIFHAQCIKESFLDKNISVILLLDTKQSDTVVSELDRKIIKYLEENKLDINIFLRKKTNFFHGKYSAWERKRGALYSLIKCFEEKTESDFLYISNKDYFYPEFLYLLDEDNMILPGEVTESVNKMIHPYNERYDILSCNNRINLYSVKTFFAKRFYYDFGYNEYPSSTRFFQSIFRKEIFCGKGIIRIHSFYKKIKDVFPSEKILSHDIIEGAVTSCGAGGNTFEDAPNDFLQESGRKKRWQRGDIQLLPFLFGRWKNDKGEKIKKNISPLYRFIILKNVFSILLQPILFVFLFVGMLLRARYFFLGVFLFILPYLYSCIMQFRFLFEGKRLKYVIKDIIFTMLRATENFFLLGHEALKNTVTFLSTFIKMFIGKNLLDWKTFYDSSNLTQIKNYVIEFLPFIAFSSFVCAGLFLFSPITLMYYVVYFCLYGFASIEVFVLSATSISDSAVKNNNMLDYAENTYKYFSYIRNKNGIVTDNVQLRPYKGRYKLTSPTDIGFSLIAEISAYRLGFIDEIKCIKNIEQIITGVEKLPKWFGNFYNWYDIDTLEHEGNFVSSVDNGNLCIMLLVVESFLKEINNNELLKRVQALLINIDLSKLFDNDRSLFYIGYDGKYSGHYDLLSSESRMLTLYYIACTKDTSLFYSLSREYSSGKSNYLLSWSGSLFENLLPELFLPSPVHSLLYQTAKTSVYYQKNTKINKVWGVSESGYHCFDEKMRYQYAPFGNKRIGISLNNSAKVVSPYSTFLALKFDDRSCKMNINRLVESGMQGEYGFFESIDFSKGKEIVRQYMTHHQGMILASICEYMAENYLSNLLNKNGMIVTVKLLLNEMPSCSYYYKKRLFSAPKEKESKEENVYIKGLSERKESFGLFDESYFHIHNVNGTSFSVCDEVFLQTKGEYYHQNKGTFFFERNKDNILVSATISPFYTEDTNNRFSFFCDRKEIVCENHIDNLKHKICLIPNYDGEVHCYESKSEKVYFYSDICLNYLNDYLSHPSFSDMFIHVKKINENTILFIREQNEKTFYMAVKVTGYKKILWECNRGNFLGRGKTIRNPELNMGGEYPSLGTVLSPCIAFYVEKEETKNINVTILFSKNKTAIIEKIENIPEESYLYAISLFHSYSLKKDANKCLYPLLYGKYSCSVLKMVENNGINDEFIKRCSDSIPFVYNGNYNNLEKFNIFLDTLLQIRPLFTSIYPMIVISDSVSRSEKREIISILSNRKISNYQFIKNDDILTKCAKIYYDSFVEINQNLCDFYKEYLYDPLSESSIDYPTIDYKTGNGGFNTFGQYIITHRPSLPYSNVICDKYGGMIITSLGGGYFYFGNSRENKICDFDNDFISENEFERFILCVNDEHYDLYKSLYSQSYQIVSKGAFCHIVDCFGLKIKFDYSLLLQGKVRFIHIQINNSVLRNKIALVYELFPSMFWKNDSDHIYTEKTGDLILIKNIRSKKSVYVRMLGGKFSDKLGKSVLLDILCNESEDFYLLFSEESELLTNLTKENIIFYNKQFLSKNDSFGKLECVSSIKSFDYLFHFLPYQVLSSRINGKTGFYQTGGATGFRDQLQDCMAFQNEPEILRAQIITCCEHQYEEGDVMHWWHDNDMGLRTKITDDRLFLVWATCRYIEFSDDFNFLQEEYCYVKSSTLSDKEKSRYELPQKTSYSESVLKHCLRAIRISLNYGEHRLICMGTGDWNDGMDKVCEKGKGESVFDSMLLYWVTMQFQVYCPKDVAEELKNIALELKDNINKFAYASDRYYRLFSDDEKWYGGKTNPNFTLDILVQSFAVLSGVADGERRVTVLETCKSLINEKLGIISLLEPPLTRNTNLGYISDYPLGVRENGGQYTHASIWYLIALCKIGRQDEAFRLFQMINPVEKCSDDDKNKMYKGEPYVFSGDVYSNVDNQGRCGWSWYTGSAGWAYRLICEEFFGLKRKGNKLFIQPKLPSDLDKTEIKFLYKNSVYLIEYEIGIRNRIMQDGIKVDIIELKDNIHSSIKVECLFHSIC